MTVTRRAVRRVPVSRGLSLEQSRMVTNITFTFIGSNKMKVPAATIFRFQSLLDDFLLTQSSDT